MKHTSSTEQAGTGSESSFRECSIWQPLQLNDSVKPKHFFNDNNNQSLLHKSILQADKSANSVPYQRIQFSFGLTASPILSSSCTKSSQDSYLDKENFQCNLIDSVNGVKHNAAPNTPTTPKPDYPLWSKKIDRRQSVAFLSSSVALAESNNLIIREQREQNVKIFVRLKPNTSGSGQAPAVSTLDCSHLEIDRKVHAFDQVFADSCTQQEVFETLARPIVQRVLEGSNGSILAYGQTGSGKTHTIFGDIKEPCRKGIVPRALQMVAVAQSRSGVVMKSMSVVEIYRQEIYDLLGHKQKPLKLKQCPQSGPYAEGLTEVEVHTLQESLGVLDQIMKTRKVGATKMNQNSSRSHTILTIRLGVGMNLESKLCIVDLAGSQKVHKSGATGEGLEEAKKINFSLSCLGNVINALSTGRKDQHIPFRDSKLTHLLKDCLSGKFTTSLIVNCSSLKSQINETLSSLKFAERAKLVKTTFSKPTIQISRLDKLRKEVARLKMEIAYKDTQIAFYQQQNGTAECFRKQRPSILQISQMFEQKHVEDNQEDDYNGRFQDLPTNRLPIPCERVQMKKALENYSLRQPRTLSTLSSINISEISSLNVSESYELNSRFTDYDVADDSLAFEFSAAPSRNGNSQQNTQRQY